MKRNKKFGVLALAFCMSLSLAVPAFAAEPNDGLKEGVSPITESVSEFLDNSPTTQTLVVSERQLIDQMLAEDEISREDLNAELSEKASETSESLRELGYNEEQISVITSYEEGEDAYNHIFAPKSGARSTSDADVTFRYGLAGSNTRRDITIAYDMTWSDCPFWTFTDS